VLMEEAEFTVQTLQQLKELGVSLAVDDFGTGYSSLLYLKRFPVDVLKIDRSFIAGLGQDAEDSTIVRAVVSLAHAMGLQAIAEGVETVEQLNELRVLRCDLAQGFHWSRPLPPQEMEAWLHDYAAGGARPRSASGS
jgi:EAL domain-containing protein (putative c-di-GMP-specific phosphodiesterase class I)